MTEHNKPYEWEQDSRTAAQQTQSTTHAAQLWLQRRETEDENEEEKEEEEEERMMGTLFHAINSTKPLCKPNVAHATNLQTAGKMWTWRLPVRRRRSGGRTVDGLLSFTVFFVCFLLLLLKWSSDRQGMRVVPAIWICVSPPITPPTEQYAALTRLHQHKIRRLNALPHSVCDLVWVLYVKASEYEISEYGGSEEQIFTTK